MNAILLFFAVFDKKLSSFLKLKFTFIELEVYSKIIKKSF